MSGSRFGVLFFASRILLGKKSFKVQASKSIQKEKAFFQKHIPSCRVADELQQRYRTALRNAKTEELFVLNRCLKKDMRTKLNENVSVLESGELRVVNRIMGQVIAVWPKAVALREAEAKGQDLIQLDHGVCLINDYRDYIMDHLDFLLQMAATKAGEQVVVGGKGYKTLQIGIEQPQAMLEHAAQKAVAWLTKRKGINVFLTFQPRAWKTLAPVDPSSQPSSPSAPSSSSSSSADSPTVKSRMEQLERTFRRMVEADLKATEVPYILKASTPVHSVERGKALLKVVYEPALATSGKSNNKKKSKKQKSAAGSEPDSVSVEPASTPVSQSLGNKKQSKASGKQKPVAKGNAPTMSESKVAEL